MWRGEAESIFLVDDFDWLEIGEPVREHLVQVVDERLVWIVGRLAESCPWNLDILETRDLSKDLLGKLEFARL